MNRSRLSRAIAATLSVSLAFSAIPAFALPAINANNIYTGPTQVLAGLAGVSRKLASDNTLQAAAYILASEVTDPDGDGYREPQAMMNIGTLAGLTAGGTINTASAAPKTDTYGGSIGYCGFDNGTTRNGAGLIAGGVVPAMSQTVFAVVSAGANKTFQTTCAQIYAGTQAQGDDYYISVNSAQLGANLGTTYWGSAVVDAAALALLNTSALTDGEIRITKDDNLFHRWNAGTSTWVPLTGSQWLSSGSDIYFTTGKVGIGVNNPDHMLSVYDAAGGVPVSLRTSGQYNGIDYMNPANSAVNAFIGFDNVSNLAILDARGAGAAISFRTQGVERMGISATGVVTATNQIVGVVGTVAGPAFTFSGRTNDGVYSPAAGTIGFTTGGVAHNTFDYVAGQGARINLYGSDGTAIRVQSLNGTFRLVNSAATTQLFAVDQAGNTSVAGTLAVAGATTLTGLLTANGGIATTTLVTTGNATVGGTLGVTGATTIGGVLTANGGIATTAINITGQAAAGVGSVAAPSYSFIGRTNDGIYSPAAGALGFATGGVAHSTFDFVAGQGARINLYGSDGTAIRVQSLNGTFRLVNNAASTQLFAVDQSGNASVAGTMAVTGATTLTGLLTANGGVATTTVSASGQVVAGVGSLAAPSYSFTGRTNDGVYSPAAGVVGLVTSGVERLRVSAAGNLLVGTSADGGQKLQVAGTSLLTGNISTGGHLIRTAAGKGHLDGNYGGSETSGTPGAIYSIGGGYAPTASSLGNMYGIGYGYSGAAGVTALSAPAGHWGFYVADNGNSRIFLSGTSGAGYFNGQLVTASSVKPMTTAVAGADCSGHGLGAIAADSAGLPYSCQ